MAVPTVQQEIDVMTISTSKKAERRDLPRRMADRVANDLYPTFRSQFSHYRNNI
jgi:hypothetical protein